MLKPWKVTINPDGNRKTRSSRSIPGNLSEAEAISVAVTRAYGNRRAFYGSRFAPGEYKGGIYKAAGERSSRLDFEVAITVGRMQRTRSAKT